MFKWRDVNEPSREGTTVWATLEHNTACFGPSQESFMINYRVGQLAELVPQLKAAGVVVLDEIAVYDYGKFVRILDPEGDKIALWEDIG